MQTSACVFSCRLAATGLVAILLGACAPAPVARHQAPQQVSPCHTGLAERLAHRLQNPDPSLPMLPADFSGGNAPQAVVACYSDVNPPPPEVIHAIEEQLYGLSLQYQLGSRWSNTASGATGSAGTPIVITWSFVPDGLTIPSGVGEASAPSNLFAQMDSKFSGNRALWIQRITDAFTRWSQLCGVSYQRITFGGNEWDDGAAWGSGGQLGRRGDVRISMKNIDGGSGILAYNSMPNQGDMVVDSSENWGNSSSNHRFLRNVIMHEHGHGLGMAHTCPVNQTKLLEPTYSGSYDGAQQDDIRAMHRFYGDPSESDNSALTANVIGSIGPLQQFTVGTPPSIIPSTPSNYGVGIPANSTVLSIDGDAEQDWFKFTLTQPLLVTTTVTPVGSTYDNQPQGGTCPSGNPINALAQADLRLQLIASNGASIIGVAESNPAGIAESLSQYLVGAGEFYVRVTETGSPNQSQLYRLQVSTGAALSMSASDGEFIDRVALSWSAIPNATTYTVFRNATNDRLSAAFLQTVATTSHDDLTAEPGTVYFYWVQATQSPGLAADLAGPETGFRALPPSCPADFNNDGNLDPDDLSDFITCFFTVPCAGADYNGDGNTDPDDLSDYITAFFAGC